MQISFEYFSDPLSTFLHNCIILSAARFSVRRCLDLLAIVQHHLIF